MDLSKLDKAKAKAESILEHKIQEGFNWRSIMESETIVVAINKALKNLRMRLVPNDW